MIALKVLGFIAGWIICGVIVYALMMYCVGKKLTGTERTWRLLICILLAPGLFCFCVVSAAVFFLFKICQLFVGRDNEDDNTGGDDGIFCDCVQGMEEE